MNRRLFLVTSALATHARSQTAVATAPLLEDLQVLRRVLQAAHTGLYRYTPKQKMDQVFLAALESAGRSTSPLDLRRAIAPLLAAIKCGHTGLGPDPVFGEAQKTSPMLPVRVSIEDGHAMVAINESVDDTVKPGMELLSINGKPMTTIAAKVLPNLSADGDIETGKLRGVGRNLPVFYYLYVEQASRFNLRLRDGNRELAVAVDGVLQSDRQKNSLANPANAPLLAARQKLEWTKDNIGLRFLKDVAQIRVGGFGGRDFPATLEKQFTEVNAKRARGLILDLRGNGGGVDNYGALLVSYLTSKPFRYFDRINMKTINPPREHTSFTEKNFERLKAGTEVNPAGGYKVLSSMHTGLNEQQPQKSAFAGKVVILIDGGSFSTCADVCAVTHHLGRATFVGEETGGGYYGNNSGESLALTLPHSKIQVNVPMWEYWNSVPGYKHLRRGTIPDHKIQARIADTLAERDRAVEKALELLI